MLDAIFILCGGFGTRLRSVVKDVPKPMALIKQKPFLSYQIKHIKKFFPNTKIYLLTYYLSDVIEDYFKSNKNIQIIKEDEPLGTGGSMQHALKNLNLKKKSNILVLNGDTYFEIDLKDMLKKSTHKITIATSFQKNCSRYGTLNIKKDKIISFSEKKEDSKNCFINAGCYLFRSLEFFDNKKNKFSIEEKFVDYLKENDIFTYKSNDKFIDIGIPKDYEKMKKYIGKKNG